MKGFVNMKKRLISFFLALSMVICMIPTLSTQSDAVIGSIISTGLKICKSVIGGTITTAKNLDYYDGNVGKAVLGQFKNIAADLTGLDIGDDYGDGDSVVVPDVSYEAVQAELKNITAAIEENNVAIHQLEATVTAGMKSLSEQMEKLSNQLKDSTEALKYYTYLNEFFAFFNQYYEAISYYNELSSNAILDQRSASYMKNVFDQFYHLQNVEYTGNLHSAVEKLGKYLRGEYMSSDPGGVVDVLSQYYILGYKAQGKDDAEAQKLAAADTEEMIAYIYYAYCMGIHFEEMVTLYQCAYMGDHGLTEYKTDFGTYRSETQMTTETITLMENAQVTVGGILSALLSNYTMKNFQLAYCSVYNGNNDSACVQIDGEEAYYWYSRSVSFNGDGFSVIPGSFFYLQDPATYLSDNFSSELRDALSGVTSYKSANSKLTVDGQKVTVQSCGLTDAAFTEKRGIDICVGDRSLKTLYVTVKHKPYNERVCWDGDGSAEYPYLITDARHFKYMNNSASHFVLAGDIDFGGNEFASYTSINTISNFSGEFDGNGYTLKNATFTQGLASQQDGWSGSEGDRYTMYGVGLFASIYGYVRNLNVQNFKVEVTVNSGDKFTGEYYAGTIAGYVCGGKIERCVVRNSTVSLYVDLPCKVFSGGIAGGVFGGGDASITDCSFIDNTNPTKEVTIYADSNTAGFGETAVGGIVGIIGRNGANQTYAPSQFPLLNYAENNTGTVQNCQLYVENKKYTTDGNYKMSRYLDARGGLTQSVGCLVGHIYNGNLRNSWILSQVDLLEPVRSYYMCTCYYGRLVGYLEKQEQLSGKYGLLKITDSNLNYNQWNTDLPIAGSQTDSQLTSTQYKEFVVDYDGLAEHVGIKYTYSDFNSNWFYLIRKSCNFGNGTTGNWDDIFRFPTKRQYVAGEYFNPNGLVVNHINTYYYPEGHVSAYRFSDETMELISKPLTAGTHTLEILIGTGASVKFEIDVAERHIYVEQIVPATCTEPGSSQMVCSECGKAKTTEVIPALGHNFENHVCTRCGAMEDCPSAAFADLDTSRWYHAGVDFVLRNGYMSGTDKGFQPDMELTREMLAQILYAKEGKPEVEIIGRFTDEDTGRWYAAAVEWAAEKGYISGYGNGKFGVGDAVTREQIAVILYAYEGKPPVGTAKIDSFADADQVDGWAKTAMTWAVGYGLITGNTRGELMPLDEATRATFAVIFYAYLAK